MVKIEEYKINPTKKIIDINDIQIIYIPLESKLGYVYKETVKVGDYVRIGEVIGKNSIAEIPLLSTTSGYVVGFENKYISNRKLVKCVVIENDFKEKYYDKPGKINNITKYSKEEFIHILKKQAIIGMSGTAHPTYIKYDTNVNFKYLIVNGCECEINASSDSARMYNNPEEILECIDAIIEIMQLKKAYIAINENNEEVIKKLLKHINTYPNIKIYPIKDGYPNGYERYLIKETLNLEYKNKPQEVKVICENVETIYAIYEALKYHKPLTERIITISGNGIKKPANYKVKIGTNLNELNQKKELFKNINNPILISGGLMMGNSIPSDEFIITPDVNCIIYKEDTIESESECLKCGKCSEVCPANLIPSLIISNKKKKKELRINRCMECGLCSYVCPAKIELREKIKEVKNGQF